MSTRSEELAQRFEKANGEFTALVNRLDDGQWRASCAAEGWSVGVNSHHLAEDIGILTDFVEMMANGKDLPEMDMDGLTQMNVEHAKRSAACTRPEVLEMLAGNSARAASVIRGLGDAQLDKAVTLGESNPIRVLDHPDARMTTGDLIEDVLIAHFREHGPSIIAAVFPTISQPLRRPATVS